MLKQRIITAILLLLALLLPFVLLEPSLALSILRILLILFCVFAAYEWGNLLPIKSTKHAKILAVGLAFIMVMVLQYGIPHYKDLLATSSLLTGLTALSLVGMFVFLYSLPKHAQTILQLISITFCFLWSACALLLFDELPLLSKLSENHSAALLLSAALPVWLADSAAYFTGKRWGKTKLAPHISPGKTWEGALGGLLTVLCFHAVAAFYWQHSVSAILFDRWHYVSFVIVIVWVAVSIAGDLFESKLKRLRGVKDSGFILPGHGGVLDRIDALLPAMAFLSLILL
jgi:phosphatidate cytidylyltransferase